MPRDKEAIFDIIESVNKILSYTAGITLTEFVANDEKQDAVLRRPLVIGEATKRLSLEFKQRYPEIPWRDIAGIRDIIVHDYNRVDIERIWNVVQGGKCVSPIPITLAAIGFCCKLFQKSIEIY
jgi:uncharacterized protein with HEPN domain